MRAMRSNVAALAVLAAASAAGAQTLINFDQFQDNQNIHGVDLGGVTLFSPNSNSIEVYANGRFGVGNRSGPNAIGNFSGCVNAGPIVGQFATPQTMVSIWTGDTGGDTDAVELRVYDANNTLLGTNRVDNWLGTPYRQMMVQAQGIVRFEAVFVGQSCGVGFDDLEFIPAPGAGALLSLAGVAALRRRR